MTGDQQVQIASTATSRSGINFNLARTRSLALQVFGFRCERKSAERQSSAGNCRGVRRVRRVRFSSIFTSLPRPVLPELSALPAVSHACYILDVQLRPRRSPPLAAASWKFYGSTAAAAGGGGEGKSNSRELIYGLIKGRREHAAPHNLLDGCRGPTLALQ